MRLALALAVLVVAAGPLGEQSFAAQASRNFGRRAQLDIAGIGEASMFSTFMNRPDGSMTFDWIFFVIVAGPMLFAAWQLFKSYRGPADNGPLQRRNERSVRPRRSRL